MITKPIAIVSHLDDREFLAQIEAVDRFTDNMLAYPGRTFGQLYHRFFRANDLSHGYLDLGGRRILLENVRVPVLVIAGESDVLAPKKAVHRLSKLLVNAPKRRYRVCPGGHLGVLTGRGARRTTWAYVDQFIDENIPAAPARKRRRPVRAAKLKPSAAPGSRRSA